VTEAEWLTCSDAYRLVYHLAGGPMGPVILRTSPPRRLRLSERQERCPGRLECWGERRLRLLACAICRGMAHLLNNERARRAIEMSERFADGKASRDEEFEAATEAFSAIKQQTGFSDFAAAWWSEELVLDPADEATWAAAFLGLSTAIRKGLHCALEAAEAVAPNVGPTWRSWFRLPERPAKMKQGVLAYEASLVRDVFGNLFRTATVGRSPLGAWKGELVQKLAEIAYEERRFPEGTLYPDRLAILGDALEDAGCTDAELLGHLRSPGPHVRGCWALDTLLGKQ
jgi:hypothetical protein